MIEQEQLVCLENYSKSLYISGDFEIEGNRVIINNREYNESLMIQDVALHNTFYKDEAITIEMLMAEYSLFCNSMHKSELLETYREHMIDIDNRAEKVGRHSHGYDYERYIIEYLDEIYNKQLSNATKDELIEACMHGAERFYNEIVMKENIDEK